MRLQTAFAVSRIAGADERRQVLVATRRQKYAKMTFWFFLLADVPAFVFVIQMAGDEKKTKETKLKLFLL